MSAESSTLRPELRGKKAGYIKVFFNMRAHMRAQIVQTSFMCLSFHYPGSLSISSQDGHSTGKALVKNTSNGAIRKNTKN